MTHSRTLHVIAMLAAGAVMLVALLGLFHVSLATALGYAAVLACPLGMLAMMLVMGHGAHAMNSTHEQRGGGAPSQGNDAEHPVVEGRVSATPSAEAREPRRSGEPR